MAEIHNERYVFVGSVCDPTRESQEPIQFTQRLRRNPLCATARCDDDDDESVRHVPEVYAPDRNVHRQQQSNQSVNPFRSLRRFVRRSNLHGTREKNASCCVVGALTSGMFLQRKRERHFTGSHQCIRFTPWFFLWFPPIAHALEYSLKVLL